MSLSPYQQLIETYGDQLRAKISSKFSASTFLAGFAATILTTLMTSHAPQCEVPYVLALGFATAASILFVQAIIRLDELSMPKHFWPEVESTIRSGEDAGLLTQEDLRALHGRMVHYWRHLTMTAALLTGLSLLVLAIPSHEMLICNNPAARFASTATSAIAAFIYVWRRDVKAPHAGQLVRPVD